MKYRLIFHEYNVEIFKTLVCCSCDWPLRVSMFAPHIYVKRYTLDVTTFVFVSYHSCVHIEQTKK